MPRPAAARSRRCTSRRARKGSTPASSRSRSSERSFGRRRAMPETIAVVGLGGMGSGAARRLLEKGYRVTVWNRSADKAAPLVELGAQAAGSPGDAAAGAGIVITFLADDRALEEVVLGADGVAARLGPGAVHLSMSTISPETG